jgi:hypothetical protein
MKPIFNAAEAMSLHTSSSRQRVKTKAKMAYSVSFDRPGASHRPKFPEEE